MKQFSQMPDRRVQALLAASMLAAISAALFFRLAVIDSVFGKAVSCAGCFHALVVSADAWFVSALLLATWISFTVRHYVVALFFRLLVLLCLVIYTVDVALVLSLSTRLNLNDISIYGRQVGLLWQHISDSYELEWWHFLGASIAAIWLVVAFAWPYRRITTRHFRFVLLIPVCLFLLGSIPVTSMTYVRQPAFKNVLQVLRQADEYRNYSAATIERVLGDDQAHSSECSLGEPQRENIILLILESWSPYQSELLTGLNDWTPMLDQLAREHVVYRDVIAAGYTTNLGLMSILAGQPLVMPILPKRVFPGAWGQKETLPRALRARGYHTAFLTSGDLAFTNKGSWLEDIGFEYLEGHDHPGYRGIGRLHFRSVPDDVLYRRSLEYLDAVTGKAPLFITIENVSTHQPFIHPITRERDMEAVFRYMDDTVYDFYLDLEQRRFFDNGILLILSDHRSMTPVFSQEREKLGRKAPSLVPMILVDGENSGRVIDAPLHQADLLPSLVARASGEYCKGESYIWPGSGFAERCRFHVRGDQRNLIDVFCHDGEGTVSVAGDDSHFIEADGLNEDRQDGILDEIARMRLRLQRQEDLFAQ